MSNSKVTVQYHLGKDEALRRIKAILGDAQNTNGGRISDVQETWMEQSVHYVTARLRWTARDYTLSMAKQRGEPGYVVEGSEETPVETTEVWTFMRHENGKWLLSAIQQPA